jgi:hypothetical protein
VKTVFQEQGSTNRCIGNDFSLFILHFNRYIHLARDYFKIEMFIRIHCRSRSQNSYSEKVSAQASRNIKLAYHKRAQELSSSHYCYFYLCISFCNSHPYRSASKHIFGVCLRPSTESCMYQSSYKPQLHEQCQCDYELLYAASFVQIHDLAASSVLWVLLCQQNCWTSNIACQRTTDQLHPNYSCAATRETICSACWIERRSSNLSK